MLKTAAVAVVTIAIVPAAHAFAGQRSDGLDRPVELWFGGDVSLGDGGRGQLDGIARIVQGDAGIVNLEGPSAERRQLRPGSLDVFSTPPSLSELTRLGVRVAGIANNHVLDAGKQAPAHTARILREHGILAAGGPAGAALLHIRGVTIAVTAHDLTHGVPQGLAVDLRAARAQADILVATFHVTGPPSYLPRPELRRAVEIAYRAGARVIAAHGTHVVGPVERREHAVIAWGLGNVIFACDCTRETDAILLRIRIQQHKPVDAAVVPIQAGVNGQPALPSPDPNGIFDLLEAIGGGKLQRNGDRASF